MWNTSKVSLFVLHVLSQDRWMWHSVLRIQLLHRCLTILALISTSCFPTTVRIQVMRPNMPYSCWTKAANSDVDCWNTTSVCHVAIVALLKRVQKFWTLPEYNYRISSCTACIRNERPDLLFSVRIQLV